MSFIFYPFPFLCLSTNVLPALLCCPHPESWIPPRIWLVVAFKSIYARFGIFSGIRWVEGTCWRKMMQEKKPRAGGEPKRKTGKAVGAAWQIASVGKLKNAVDRFFLLSACSCQPPPVPPYHITFPFSSREARKYFGMPQTLKNLWEGE